jgi:hypothetical protein
MTDPAMAANPTVSSVPLAQRRWVPLVLWAFILAIAALAIYEGMHLRRYAWDQTEQIRFVTDINNAVVQGNETLKTGYIERYDQEMAQPSNDVMDLDYAPGRMAVATLWAHWLAGVMPPQRLMFWQSPTPFYYRARSLHRQYELCEPMLMVNLTGEILSAVAMFLLVRRYTAGKAPRYRPMRGAILGLIAALFFWFNPALIWNAHCWPQWDSWVLPFFLWAVLLASLDWWFCAGVLMATGAMFKGQILFGAPLFLLWPLFQLRIGALTRWIAGLFTAVAAITAVWLVRVPGFAPQPSQYVPGYVNPLSIQWLIYMALIFAAIVPLLLLPRQPRARIPVGVVVAAVITWIIGRYTGGVFSIVGFIVLTAAALWVDQLCNGWNWRARLPLGWIAVAILLYPLYVLAKDWFVPVIIATVIVGLLISLGPRRIIPYTAAAWMAGALFMCVPFFGASMAWFKIGIAYGTTHRALMASESNNNLAELLQSQWGWDNLMEPVFKIPKGPVADSLSHFLADVDPGVKIKSLRGTQKPRPVRGRTPRAVPETAHLEPGEFGLPLKYALLCLWIVSVILCAIGTAIHDRRRSPRFLASIAAPWIMFFAVMTQMHQRYLLWGASLSAATAVLSPGYAVLHLFLSVVSASQEMMSMMNNHLDGSHPVEFTDNAAYQFFDAWHPGVSWAVLLTACVFVYTSVKWDRVKSPKPEIFTAETQRRGEERDSSTHGHECT